MIPINTVDDCINKIRKDGDMIPDSGYNVVSVKVGFNRDGSTYPRLTLLRCCKSWDEAEAAEAVMAKEHQGLVDRVIILPTEKRKVEPPYKTSIEKALEDVEFHTPKTGYNLCSFDDFEEPGEVLYLKGHYDTYQEALDAKAEAETSGSDANLVIYPSKMSEEDG